jgi:hypothetical protein
MASQSCSTETSFFKQKVPVSKKGFEVIQVVGACKPSLGSAVSMDVWV